jgi:hypothetical protein
VRPGVGGRGGWEGFILMPGCLYPSVDTVHLTPTSAPCHTPHTPPPSGSAVPASDLYALGGTLLYLVSGQPPFAFPQERMRIGYKDRITVGAQMGGEGRRRGGDGRWCGPAASKRPVLIATLNQHPPNPPPPHHHQPPTQTQSELLDGLLEPVAEDRLTAQEAIDVATGKAARRRKSAAASAAAARPAESQAVRTMRMPDGSVVRMMGQGGAARPLMRGVKKPAGTRVQLERSGARLDIEIPPEGLNGGSVGTGLFAVAWNAFVAVSQVGWW